MIAPDVRRAPDSWRAACAWLPRFVHLGQVLIGPGGEVLRVSQAGRLEVVIQGALPFHRSIASDPTATRSRD